MQEVPAKSDALVRIVETSGLEKTKAQYILEKFQDYFQIAADWEAKAKILIVTSDNQVAEMKMAREGRLFLRSKRIDIEKARKELKEQSLREGKAIDGIANVLRALIEPIENHLEEQERFIELRDDRAKEERKAARIVELQSIGLEPSLYDLKQMSEEIYQNLVLGQKSAIQRRIEAEKQAEADRVAREKEQERIRLENDRLHKEAEKKEKEMVKERAKAEAEKQAMAAKAKQAQLEAEARERKLKAEQELKLKKEREEREKVEAELRAKAEAEKREKKRIEDEEKAAKRAPDKQKLVVLADVLDALELPVVKSAEAKKILEDVKGLIVKTSQYIRTQTEKL